MEKYSATTLMVTAICDRCRSLVCLSTAFLMLTVACANAQIIGEAETRKFVSCRTLVTWTGPQGTQVSYYGAGGKAYLWAPGNDTVLAGTWRVDPNATSPQSRLAFVAVCVQYDGGAQRDCRPAEILERITMDHADGDVFGLEARSAAPFRLARDRTNIAMLQQRLRTEAPDAAQPPRPAAKCE
jgi:hypothetical protein